MRSQRRSYLKTCLPAAILTLVGCIQLAKHPPVSPTQQFVGAVGWFICFLSGAVAVAGFVVFWRDRAFARGHEDLFLRFNRSRSERNLAVGVGGRRSRFLVTAWPGSRRRLRVGDEVQVLPLGEIQRTLDADATLDGLPFQPEMAAYCGRRFRVYRRIDKIHDYRRTGRMRRLEHAVLLVGLRCDGSAHDSCQARCYLIWKEAWLTPVPRSSDDSVRSCGVASQTLATSSGSSVRELADRRFDQSESAPHERSYRCQFTQLAAASSPLRDWDVRQDLRPLISGNVTLRAFSIAMLTRLFNEVQALRRGVPFPSMSPGEPTARVAASSVAPGEHVRVRRAEEIAMTLDARGRNLGLWFDLDMLRYCGRAYEVTARVERIIDGVTGRMLHLRTSCLTLDGVAASGEYLRFCSQHEQIFWREIWLRPVEHDARKTTTLAS